LPKPPPHLVFLAVGLVAASQSGNIIRMGEAPAVAIAAWRLVLATLILAPFAWRQRAQLAGLTRRDLLLLGVAGMALAGHFITFIAGVQHTTVANAMLIFAVNPVFTATVGVLFLGERVDRRLLASIALGLGGVGVIGGADLSLSPEHLLGDGLVLLCSVLFTLYFVLGKHLRGKLSSTLYVTSLYGMAALPCALAVLLGGHPVLDYDGRTWLCFLLMAAVPTLIGHSAMNHALRWVDASRVAAATLVEPLLGGLVALWIWSEPLGPTTFLGYGLIGASVLALIWGGSGTKR
jgi:drug/metabolite transporter (DMT)-like permease